MLFLCADKFVRALPIGGEGLSNFSQSACEAAQFCEALTIGLGGARV